MKLYEKDIEDLIWERIKTNRIKTLNDKGLYLRSAPHVKHYRQLKIGGYGVADIVQINSGLEAGSKHHAEIEIIELKAVGYKHDHLEQLSRYMTGAYHKFINHFDFINVYGALVCRNYETSTPYINTLLSKISFYDFDFCLDNGISFNSYQQDVMLESPKFSEKVVSADSYKSISQ